MNDLSIQAEYYINTADKLIQRIKNLGPIILKIDNAWDLFKLGLKCKDLSPTLFQANWALTQAKKQMEMSNET